MMPAQFYQQLRQQLDDARQEGLFKQERIITSAQQTEIAVGRAMMPAQFYQQLRQQLDDARQEGLFKQERIITSAQQTEIA
ncbi:hypothetical protein HZD82_24245, partial [Pantoea agglomerans]|nr:hypothetical protein [Pantoea agglomerans]